MRDIQSNAIRGEYLTNIMDKTINEIHDDLKTVFGPFATDAFLTKDGQPYYTRDGKETIRLLKFDNELSMYVLKIMYQAVYQQGAKVGDGTTTLAIFYTNLYKEFRKIIKEKYDNDVTAFTCGSTRKHWNNIISKLNERITANASKLTKEDLKQLLYTCTQDSDLAAKIYDKLADPIMDQAYITIDKSNIESDFNVNVHSNPIFKATKQWSLFPVHPHEERCTILHCNGVLDIAHYETLSSLMSYVESFVVSYDGTDNPERQAVPKTIILLCNGISAATRESIKTLNTKLQQLNVPTEELKTNYNNVAIYTLDEYRSYNSEQIEDISTIITDENGITGLVNQLTFESLLHQAMAAPNVDIPELQTFDADIRHLDKIRAILTMPYAIDFDEVKGIRIYKTLGPIAQARYDELRQQIENEKSEVKQIDLKKRLRTMYGQFIEVEVGSKLMKDSQRKYELILDAILSSSEGVEKGILRANSLLIAYKELGYLMDNDVFTDPGEVELTEILYNALAYTIYDLVSNGWNVPTDNIPLTIGDWVLGYEHDFTRFNLKRNVKDFRETLPSTSDQYDMSTTKVVVDGSEVEFTDQIIEPVSIITTMLENSTIMYELATARTVHTDTFMQNYI